MSRNLKQAKQDGNMELAKLQINFLFLLGTSMALGLSSISKNYLTTLLNANQISFVLMKPKSIKRLSINLKSNFKVIMGIGTSVNAQLDIQGLQYFQNIFLSPSNRIYLKVNIPNKEELSLFSFKNFI